MKKINCMLLVCLILMGCSAKKEEVPVGTPEATASPQVVFTPDTNPQDRPYPTPNGKIEQNYDYNVEKNEDSKKMKITFYDRATDIIGHSITIFDSNDQMLSSSSGFSTVNEYITIDDERAYEQKFSDKETSIYEGDGFPTLDIESNNYLKISCFVYLKDKIEQPCSETYLIPNAAGFSYKIYLVKDSEGNYKFSPTEE